MDRSRSVMKPTWTRATALIVACITPALLFACSSSSPSSHAQGGSSASSGTLSSQATLCEGDQSICSDGCVDLATSAKHCGECGHGCAATEHCQSGACVKLTCGTGLTACSSECKDVVNDPTNCGSCGHACEGSARCVGGKCSLMCPAGAVTCAGKCIEPNADPTHCGATAGCGESGGSPGMVCGASTACLGGQCIADCGDGRDLCPAGCVDFRSDDHNCGSCGARCTAGRHCSQRICCLAGETACMGSCRDTSSDPTACGGCGVSCADGAQCVAGVCTP